jgi:hypothetical protein
MLTRIGYVTHIEDAVLQMDWATNSQYIRVNIFAYESMFYKVNFVLKRQVQQVIKHLFFVHQVVKKLKIMKKSKRWFGIHGQGKQEQNG